MVSMGCWTTYWNYKALLSISEDSVFRNFSRYLIISLFSFPESKDVLKPVKRKKDPNGCFIKKSKLAEYSDKIEENFNSYTNFRNQVLQKWHDRTKTAKDTKNPAANLNIITKIENALLNKNELVRKSQLYRGDYDIYGVDKPEPSDETQNEMQIPEIFDDSEFYHQLLRELIEYKSNTDENQSEITKKFIELQKVRSKMKKKVDTRASKGRKIRYVVHNKLVNFMPPTDTSEMTDEAKNELYNSLFGMANEGSSL
jgi:protein AATF/BFR2